MKIDFKTRWYRNARKKGSTLYIFKWQKSCVCCCLEGLTILSITCMDWEPERDLDLSLTTVIKVIWELMAVRKCNVFVPGNMVCCTLVFPIVAHNALTSVSYLSLPHLCTAFKIALHSFCGNSLCGLKSNSMSSSDSCPFQAQSQPFQSSNALQCWLTECPLGWTGQNIMLIREMKCQHSHHHHHHDLFSKRKDHFYLRAITAMQ